MRGIILVNHGGDAPDSVLVGYDRDTAAANCNYNHACRNQLFNHPLFDNAHRQWGAQPAANRARRLDDIPAFWRRPAWAWSIKEPIGLAGFWKAGSSG